MIWKTETFGSLLTESRIPCENPDIEKRIRVKLNVQGVEKRPVGAEKEGATKQFIRKAGQFIYGKQNFHKGAFGVIPEELDGFETSADIPSFDVRKDCLPEWIYYFFKAGNRYLELTEFARGVGSQRIHPKQLQDLEIPLPPIDVQRKIIAELEVIEKDEISSELTHQLDLVKQLRQAFLREAMQGKLVPQDPNDESASVLLEKIKAEKERLIKEKKIKKQKPLAPINEVEIPFDIPENWVWCRLGGLRDFKYTLSYGVLVPGNDVSDGVPFVRVQDLDNAHLNQPPSKSIAPKIEQKFAKTRLEGGEILICVVGSIGKLAKTCSAWIGANIARAVCRLMPNKEIDSDFLFYCLQSPVIQDYFRGGKRSINPTLNVNILESTLIPLPPLSEQERIVAKLDELMVYCDTLEVSIKESQQQNELLLQQVLREALEPVSDKSSAGRPKENEIVG